MSRPNILVLMVDQLNGTLFPDGPADWLHTPALKALAAPLAPLRPGLYRLAALRAGPGELHDRPAALVARGSTTMPPNSPPTCRPMRITCAAPAIRPALRARCISSGPTSSTVSRRG